MKSNIGSASAFPSYEAGMLFTYENLLLFFLSVTGWVLLQSQTYLNFVLLPLTV